MLLKANPDHWLWLIISILIVWRLTTLICYEAGPFNVMSKIRLLLYRIKLGNVVDCFHCAAVWVSIFVTLAVYKVSIVSLFLTIAVAGGASIIEKLISYGSNTQEETNDANP